MDKIENLAGVISGITEQR
jgi:hypothetical protein